MPTSSSKSANTSKAVRTPNCGGSEASNRETQGRRLIARLKRSPHTYMEMLMLGWSVSPWKRIRESLAVGEKLVKGRDKSGRTTWSVRRA